MATSELASCVPNSDAGGEVALLAILGYFEGGAKKPSNSRPNKRKQPEPELSLREASVEWEGARDEEIE